MIFKGAEPATAVSDAEQATTEAITQYNKDNF
jgi:hypothetical protein